METKYNCEKCQYKCNYISEWNEHLTCKKHTGEKRKERCDKILVEKCTFCDYKSTKTSNMKLHILTHHSTKEDRKKEMKHYCDNCDFGTNATILFQRHLETQKHLLTTNK
jgi:ribosomal protein L35